MVNGLFCANGIISAKDRQGDNSIQGTMFKGVFPKPLSRGNGEFLEVWRRGYRVKILGGGRASKCKVSPVSHRGKMGVVQG